MKISTILAVALLLESVYGAAIVRREPQRSVPGVVSFPIKRRHHIQSVGQDIARRDGLLGKRAAGTVSLPLQNAQLLYYANGIFSPLLKSVLCDVC